MEQGSGSSSKIERNIVERNRRKHMNDLFSMLSSVICQQADSKDTPPVHLLLDQATAYVKHLQERIHELERRKELLKGDHESRIQDKMTERSISPVIDLGILDSTLEVNLISGSKKKLTLREVISVLEEEGAEVVAANYSTLGDRTLYTIHCQAISSRIGIEVSNVDEKLKKLVL